MPNLEEFINNKVEHVYKAELQKINGIKPCAKCEKDVESYYWDATKLTMSWTCPNGHENSFTVQ